MILCTWNFEYALQLQSTMFSYFYSFSLCEISNAFNDAFRCSKIHFQQSGSFKLINLNNVVLIGLSPVWNRYPKCSYQAFNNRV